MTESVAALLLSKTWVISELYWDWDLLQGSLGLLKGLGRFASNLCSSRPFHSAISNIIADRNPRNPEQMRHSKMTGKINGTWKKTKLFILVCVSCWHREGQEHQHNQ